MRAGYAKTDITPSKVLQLSGYGWYLGRAFEGIDDRLYARAAVFEESGKKILLINCDLIAVKKEISDHVRMTLAGEFEIKKPDIMIACTHTHTGPATGTLVGLGEEDPGYINELKDKLVDVGRKALSKLKDAASIGSISVEIEPISFNRVFEDGPVDKTVRGFCITFEDKSILDVLSYPSHPVTRGVSKNISADFPGKVCEALEKQGRDAIFITGVCGDINPRTHKGFGGKGDEETITGFGKRVADVVMKEMAIVDPVIDSDSFFPVFKLQKYTSKEIDMLVEKYAGEKSTTPGMMKVIRIWADYMKEVLANDNNPYEEELEIQVFKIGSIFIIGFPGEAFTALAEIIRNKMPGRNVIVAGNVNSTMRYIPTKEDIINNGYAGLVSNFFYLRFPLEAGESERVAEEIADYCLDRF